MAERQIMRIWRGWTRRADAAAYEDYLLRTGFAGYTATEGNAGAYFTCRHDAGRTEFCLVTLWSSWEAIRSFAGEEPAKAVFYPEDDRFLVDRELTVSHYEVFASS
jgi:heme-degrading monooxygenase HmoA